MCQPRIRIQFGGGVRGIARLWIGARQGTDYLSYGNFASPFYKSHFYTKILTKNVLINFENRIPLSY